MELVFIHGWGFDARFWDQVCALIPQFPQRRVDRGYFGLPSAAESFGENSILIGHSLGFLHGVAQKQDWGGWIAINAFTRFIPDCVPEARLREMKMGMAFASDLTLRTFYARIGAEAPSGSPDIARLRSGLDELQTCDITATLGQLDAPGLVLAAHNDPLVPVVTSEALGKLVRRGGGMWHETAGHILPLNDPAWCAKAITSFAESFLKQHDRRQKDDDHATLRQGRIRL